MNLKATLLITLFCIAEALSAQLFSDNYYHYMPEESKSNDQWMLLLPGSSGLTIFDDKHFYHRKAEAMKNLGFTVILLDYKALYKSINNKNKPKGTAGDKIAWTVKQAISMALLNKHIKPMQKGHLLGWSLAGEGIFNLLKDTSFITVSNIQSAALFYPSNERKESITTPIPLLIQIGEADNVVDAEGLKEQISDHDRVRLIYYPQCAHGFDIESLSRGRKIRFPPIFGKQYLFQYNEESAKTAYSELIRFLIQ